MSFEQFPLKHKKAPVQAPIESRVDEYSRLLRIEGKYLIRESLLLEPEWHSLQNTTCPGPLGVLCYWMATESTMIAVQ